MIKSSSLFLDYDMKLFWSPAEFSLSHQFWSSSDFFSVVEGFFLTLCLARLCYLYLSSQLRNFETLFLLLQRVFLRLAGTLSSDSVLEGSEKCASMTVNSLHQHAAMIITLNRREICFYERLIQNCHHGCHMHQHHYQQNLRRLVIRS